MTGNILSAVFSEGKFARHAKKESVVALLLGCLMRRNGVHYTRSGAGGGLEGAIASLSEHASPHIGR